MRDDESVGSVHAAPGGAPGGETHGAPHDVPREPEPSACVIPGCIDAAGQGAPIPVCTHHRALGADWVAREYGAEDALPTPCPTCGARVGIRYPSGWVCSVCEWVYGTSPDDDLPLPRVDVVYYIRFDDRMKIGHVEQPAAADVAALASRACRARARYACPRACPPRAVRRVAAGDERVVRAVDGAHGARGCAARRRRRTVGALRALGQRGDRVADVSRRVSRRRRRFLNPRGRHPTRSASPQTCSQRR